MTLSPGGSPSPLNRAVEEIPLPSTLEGILTVLRRVLSKPFVQSVTLSTDSPIEVVWYKDVTDSLDMEDPDDTPDIVLSRVSLDEFSGTNGPKSMLVEATLSLNQKGILTSHLFVGSVDHLRDWFGIPVVRPFPLFEGTQYTNFMNLRLIEVPSLNEDVVVLLGAGVAGPSLSELTNGLKLTI